MSKFLSLIQNKVKNQRLNAKPKSWYKFLLSTQVLNIAVVIAICFAGVLYLAEINGMAIKGFKIKELEEKETRLKENIRKSELQIADLQSLQRIQERISILNMVSVAKVDYIAAGGAVAVK